MVYGLDIETDTTVDGLDPAVAPIVTVALSNDGSDEVFSGPEHAILYDLDTRLSELTPGVIATWNGAAFDLPFLSDRASLHGIPLGLRLRPDPGLRRLRSLFRGLSLPPLKEMAFPQPRRPHARPR